MFHEKFVTIFLLSAILSGCAIWKDNSYFYSSTFKGDDDLCYRRHIRVKGNKMYTYTISDCNQYWYFENKDDTVDIDQMKEEFLCDVDTDAPYYLRKRKKKLQIGFKNQYKLYKMLWSDLYSFEVNDTVRGIRIWSTHAGDMAYEVDRIYIQDSLLTIPVHFENVECYLFKEHFLMNPINLSYWQYSFIDKETFLPIYTEAYKGDSLYSKNILVNIW